MNQILAMLQRLVVADKTVIVAACVQTIVALVSGLGLHLSGAAVGTISALVAVGLGYFVHVHFATKHQAEHAAK